MIGETHDDAFGQRTRDGAVDGAPCLLVDDVEYVGARPSPGVVEAPSRQVLGDRIHEGNAALLVCGNDRIPDALQRRLEPLALLGDGFLGAPFLSHVTEDQHHSDRPARGVANRGGAVRDGTGVPSRWIRTVWFASPAMWPERSTRPTGFSAG